MDQEILESMKFNHEKLVMLYNKVNTEKTRQIYSEKDHKFVFEKTGATRREWTQDKRFLVLIIDILEDLIKVVENQPINIDLDDLEKVYKEI